jgi:hypothetical protein
MARGMSPPARDLARAAVLFAAPVVLLAGILAHPFVENYLETAVVASAVSAAPDRWAVAHVVIPVGMVLLLLAVVAIRGEFRRAGEDRWSIVALPLLFVGGGLWAAVGASEITLAAVVNSGGDVLTVMETNQTWMGPYVVGAALLFALGWVSLGVAFYQSPILPRPLNRLAIAMVAIIVLGFGIPQTTGTYALGAGALTVSWLVGYRVFAATTAVRGGAKPAVDS